MEFENYQNVQSIAKDVLSELGATITSSSTENSIASSAFRLLKKRGISETWYHGVPALVLLGSRSCLSISGKEYLPSDELVGDTNLITVDLSPKIDDYWGDCARTFCFENGSYKPTPEKEEYSLGCAVQETLHKSMINFVTPKTTFSDLYNFGNDLILKMGYENLDFLSNLGHSIETQLKNRKYIDQYCSELLSNVKLFTFEPHIRVNNGEWGYKHENIYYFTSNGIVDEL